VTASTISLIATAHPRSLRAAVARSGAAAEMGGAPSNNGHMIEHRLMIHRIRKEIGGGGGFSTLSKTNYYDYVVLMHMVIQARA